MKWVGSAVLLTIAVVLGRGVESQQSKKRASQEQTRFGLEESVNQPVRIPEPVQFIQSTDPDVRTSRCVDEDQSLPKISVSWFEASQIHLTGPKEMDLLVKAKDGCLFGANIGPFWLFKRT
jgi:hypothetical protein